MADWFTASRLTSVFTFCTAWGGWGNGMETPDDFIKPLHMVMYGLPSWPSSSLWILPQ